MVKLMVSIREDNFRLLSLEARERGITIQELLRAVIVPDWIRSGKTAEALVESAQQRPISMIMRESVAAASSNRSRYLSNTGAE